MGLKKSLVFFIPDNVRNVEVLRVGSACYPHGIHGEPDTLAEAMRWAVQSPWGRDKLEELGVTYTWHDTVTAAKRRPATTHTGVS